ncbi:MAG: ABC transporter ATP-binding protein [Bacteroidetes bacterium QH_9_67_14]|nr:MAG: ABC transporter ATP-binding protein [Bacteroidetes bacterium QH_9_67_14]
MPAAVEVEGVTHRYPGGDGAPPAALRDFSLTVPPGEAFALLGPNGSGKTTLFRILATLMPPTEGAARVFGQNATSEPDAVRRQLGVVFQEPALDEALTVAENLRFHGAFFGMGGPALEKRLTDLLGRFGLTDRRADRVRLLSGGLRRRADLARGPLHAPPLLLLDEPTAGLDPAARRAFWDHLARLQEQDDTTLLVATHLMDEADRSDRVAILHEGERVACGAPEALKRDLGERTLRLESSAPDALRRRLQAQLGLDAQRVGDTALHVACDDAPDDAPALLARLYDAFPDQIESATVRRPTLVQPQGCFSGIERVEHSLKSLGSDAPALPCPRPPPLPRSHAPSPRSAGAR